MSNSSHPTYGSGKICYLEIPAVDIQASANFYEQLFGWVIRKRKDGTIAFDDSVFEVSGTWVTGRKPASEQGFLIYIMVDDIEKSIRQLEAYGGKLVQPVGMDAPEITARFRDPAGNVLGLYQPPAK